MKSFIHTFCISTKLNSDEYKNLKAAYPEMVYYRDMHKHLLNTYKDQGLRIEIFQCKEIEVKMDKENCWNKLYLIFTTYKLLHNGEKMGAVTDMSDLETASKKAMNLLDEIYDTSGVDLLKRASVKRVDITKDVTTPSDDYTNEIIRIAKEIDLPYGYKIWNPLEEDKKLHPEWNEDKAIFIYNHHQEIEYKLYDKKTDLVNQDENTDFLNGKSLLRFELTLKKNILMKLGYIKLDRISFNTIQNMLQAVTMDADCLLQTYIGDSLSSGDILSKKMLKKYIKAVCGSKVRRAEKMIEYIGYVAKGKSNDYGSDKAVRSIEREFDNLDISAVYSKEECPYIPSIEKLLSEQEANHKLLYAAKRYNEKRGRRDLVYWE